MPRPPFDPSDPNGNQNSSDSSFFDFFRDRVMHVTAKHGAGEPTWEDVWQVLLAMPQTAQILEDRGISIKGMKRDISYAAHFGKPDAYEQDERIDSRAASSIREQTVAELVGDVRNYADHVNQFDESEDYRDASLRVAEFLQQFLQVESEDGSEKQRMKVALLSTFINAYLRQIRQDETTHGNQAPDFDDAADALRMFAQYMENRSMRIVTNPLERLAEVGDEFDGPSPYRIVETAINLADEYTTYALYRNGMVAPDNYEPLAHAHPDIIQTTALHAFEYADLIREKEVSPKHMLGVMLEDWNIIKHLKKVEELELKERKEKGEDEKTEPSKKVSVLEDYRNFFNKVRKAIEPGKQDGERFRKVRVVSDDLNDFIRQVAPIVEEGADELASVRLFGELLKREDVREALKSAGMSDAMLDRWPEAMAKSNEAIADAGGEKQDNKYKVSDEELEFLLGRFSRDLTKEAMLGKLDPVIGRESEADQMVEVALQRNRSNGLLLGDAGVGKSALFSALAQRIASGQVPETLLGAKVHELDIQKMNEGAMYVGMFEARLKPILEGLAERNRSKESPPQIVCMDEIAENMKVGGVSNASEIMKPILSKGGLIAFAATTQDEYQKVLRKDKAFDRRFQVIHVDEPKPEHTEQILEKSQREALERHYKITIAPELMKDVVRLTKRFLAGRKQPDASITTLDQSCAKAKMKGKDILELGDIMEAVAKAAHLDPEFIQHSSDRILQLDDMLHDRVVGQDEPLTQISNALVTANAGLQDPNKPMGAFLMLGPTGVGKTETGRALAEILHGSRDAMIRIDMGKYKEAHSLSGLIGAPPGYVGYDEEGELTGQVRKKPYSVIVLDEIEKAHPDVFKYLLSILEEGEIVSGNNERIDFRNTIILMTSNSKDPQREYPQLFKPELMNRLSGVLHYKHLTPEHIHALVDREVGHVSDRMQAQWGLSIDLGENARTQLAERGFNKDFGARELKRVVAGMVSTPLSHWLLRNRGMLPKQGSVALDDIDQFSPKLATTDEKIIHISPQTHAERLAKPKDPRDVFPSSGAPGGEAQLG